MNIKLFWYMYNDSLNQISKYIVHLLVLKHLKLIQIQFFYYFFNEIVFS